MSWWDWIKIAFSDALSIGRKHATWLGVIFPVLAPLLALWGLYELLEPELVTLTNKLNTSLGQINVSGTALFSAKVNRIFPLTEAFAMIVSLLGIKVAAAVIRMIKSVIPTIS